MRDIEYIHNEAGIPSDQVTKTAETLLPYVEELRGVAKANNYEAPEASINLPLDKEFYEDVLGAAQELASSALRYVVVVGIGGSNLGTQAIYEALRKRTGEEVKMFFLDTVNSEELATVLEALKSCASSEEFLVNIISKSGTTTETIANTSTLFEHLEEKFGPGVYKRAVAITDEGSKLATLVVKKEIKTFTIPKNVGGRYSVLSAVGLFPLMVAGFDISQLLRGARSMRDKCISTDIEKNPALLSATLIYLHYTKGISIHNVFLFHPYLEFVGKWYRQLMGESIGKKGNTNGETVHAGITPVVSIGSTDLHSMAQLYFAGPRDKFTTFVSSPAKGKDVKVPEESQFNGLVSDLSGKSFGDIMGAIYSGVTKAYEKNKLPYVEIMLPKLDEQALGGLLQMKMLEMMYLAQLLHVNAFDQPNVEDYKKETKHLLKTSE